MLINIVLFIILLSSLHAEHQRNVSAVCVEPAPNLIPDFIWHLRAYKEVQSEVTSIAMHAPTTCSPLSLFLDLEVKDFVQSLTASRTTRILPYRKSKKQHESKWCCLQNPNHMYAIDCNFFLLYAADREKCPKDICKYKRAYPGTTWVQCTSCGQWWAIAVALAWQRCRPSYWKAGTVRTVS